MYPVSTNIVALKV